MKCTFSGCPNPVLAKNACQLHVALLCLAPDCMVPAKVGGYCVAHHPSPPARNRTDINVAIKPEVYDALKDAADEANMDTRTYIHWVIEQLWAPRADEDRPAPVPVDGHGRPLEYRTKDARRLKRRLSITHNALATLEKHATPMGWAMSSYARWVLEDFWPRHR